MLTENVKYAKTGGLAQKIILIKKDNLSLSA